VLVVLTRSPVTSPLEACLREKFEAEVVMVYLVEKVFRAVAILHGCGGLNVACTVFAVFIVRIVEGIDVHC
jgi:hypothetical protein